MSYDGFLNAMAYAFEPDAAVFDLAHRIDANHESPC